MDTFKLVVLASDKPFYEGECESLEVPTADGQYGVLAHHMNQIAAIVLGMLKYRAPGETEFKIAAVSQGLIKIEDNEVLILADTAERPEEIDINRAKRDAEEAREAIMQKKSIMDYKSAQAKMARAINRLRVKESKYN